MQDGGMSDERSPNEGPRGQSRPQAPAGSRPTPESSGHLADSRRGQFASASRAVGRGSARAAGASGRMAKATVTRVRAMLSAGGAGESGLARLLELHAFNTAGDSALAVSLAGSLFFQVPTNEARGQVALFLGLTMLPFAIVAPLVGPFIDRFRGGRRWAIGATMATRAFGCWALAGAVTGDSPWLFPAALTCLVASKAYGVTRAAAVPRLLPPGEELVKINSRISLTGIAAAAVSGPIAGLAAVIGPQWSLRYASALFVVATVLAVLLPSRVDSAEGEEQIGYRTDARGRRIGIPAVVIKALRCNAALRALSGFLTMFMAFLLRSHPFSGWEDRKALLLGLVIGAAGVGSILGTAIGSRLRNRKPESIVIVVLAVDAGITVACALFYGLPLALALGLTVGICQALGKVSLDALIQRETPEVVRTSVFARSETLLQLSWVVGGLIGIAMPLVPQLGLGLAGAGLVVWLAFVIRASRAPQAPVQPAQYAPPAPPFDTELIPPPGKEQTPPGDAASTSTGDTGPTSLADPPSTPLSDPASMPPGDTASTSLSDPASTSPTGTTPEPPRAPPYDPRGDHRANAPTRRFPAGG
jgi:MFS family permease